MQNKGAAFIELEVEGIGLPSPQDSLCKCWTLQINVFPTTKTLARDVKNVVDELKIRERIW